MAKQDDSIGGYCCCGVIVVGVVVAAVGKVLDFIGNHPVWTALIVAVLVGLTIVMIVGAKGEKSSADAPHTTGRGALQSKPKHDHGDSGPADEGEDFWAEYGRPPATADHDASGQRDDGSAPAHEPSGRDCSTLDGVPASPGLGDIPAGTAVSSAQSPLAETLDGPSVKEPAQSFAEKHRSHEPGTSASPPLMDPPTFIQTVKRLLRLDDWSILGAGLASHAGGIDIVVGIGQSVIAVQCHAAGASSMLDTSTMKHLLDAPFDVHAIKEVVIVSSVPVSDDARREARSSELNVHVVDADEFYEWQARRRRLEPVWGLVTPAR